MCGGRVVVVLALAGCAFHAGGAVDSGSADPDARRGDGRPGDGFVPADSAPGDATLQTDPTIVQQKANSATSGSPLSVTLASSPTAGNVLVMIGAANSGGLTSVSGGGVATWMLAAKSLAYANIEIWFGVTNGSSSTITIAKTGNPFSIWITVTEWSGLATTSTLDGAQATSGMTGTAGTGALTTTHARDLLLFAVADDATGMFGTPGPASWNAAGSVTAGGDVQAQWYRVISAVGTTSPTVSDSGQRWDAANAALKIAP